MRDILIYKETLMTPNEKTLWNKTSDEITVADSLKVACITTAASIAVMAGTLLTLSAAATVKEKYQKAKENRKKLKKLKQEKK